MISRKIKSAARTLSNIKYHVEPGVWKVMSRAVNILIESADEVWALEKKMRLAGSDPPAGEDSEMSPAEVGDVLECMAAALRRSGNRSNRPAPKAETAAVKSNSNPSLSLVPASEVKR